MQATNTQLTNRERDIAAYIARGLTNKEIAAKLEISHRTVEAHLTKILRMLGLRNRTELAGWWINR